MIRLIDVASGKQVSLPKLPAGEIAAEFIEAFAEMKVASHVAQTPPDGVRRCPIGSPPPRVCDLTGKAQADRRIRQVMVRGLAVDQVFILNMTAYNLTRMRTLGQLCLQSG